MINVITARRLGRVLHAMAGALASGSMTPEEVAKVLTDVSNDLINGRLTVEP